VAELGLTLFILWLYLIVEMIYEKWSRQPSTRQRQARDSKPANPLKEDENE
jgi:hypothetical protein